MRKMTLEEISISLKNCSWASICTTCEDGSPYAIEATPFFMDDLTCFMVNPRGGTYRNMQHNTAVLLKYTIAKPSLEAWVGISCFGIGQFITDSDHIRQGWGLLGQVMGQDYTAAADKFSQKFTHSPLFAATIHTCTGRTSAAKNEVLPIFSPSKAMT